MATRYKIATQDRAETLSNKTINEAKGADIASATTTDIGAATGNYVNVTGTTTITGLGTVQAGTRRIVNFTGALTLTHNATSLILPTAANITTAAGDTAVFVSLGSGNWKCVSYDRASGEALVGAGGGTTKIFEAHNTMMSAHAGSELYNTSVGFPSEDKWTDTAAITPTYYANGVYLNTGGGGKLSLPLLGVNATMHWNDGRNFAASIGCYFASDTQGSSGFGFSTEQIDWDSSTATSLRIGFESRSGPALKAVTADGTTLLVSADLDSNITYDRIAIFGIFVNVDTSTAYFYINGVLRATLSISTLASNSGQIGWNFSYGGQNVNHRVSEFIVSNEVY